MRAQRRFPGKKTDRHDADTRVAAQESEGRLPWSFEWIRAHATDPHGYAHTLRTNTDKRTHYGPMAMGEAIAGGEKKQGIPFLPRDDERTTGDWVMRCASGRYGDSCTCTDASLHVRNKNTFKTVFLCKWACVYLHRLKTRTHYCV